MSNRLLHTKVSKRKPLNHFPDKKDGHDGDMQIVSIDGKGTYLCIKTKGGWKISDKFNPKNKFDTHIFDEITTRKIKSQKHLIMSFGTVSTTIGGDSVAIPIIKLGDGSNPSIITTLGSNKLYFETGITDSPVIKLHSTGITNYFSGTDKQQFQWSSATSGAGRVLLYNTLGDALLECQVITNKDRYIRFTEVKEATNAVHALGADATDDSFKLTYGTSLTQSPSDSTSLLTIDTSGNTTVSGTLTSSAGVCGGPKVTNYITNDANDTMAGTLAITSTTADQFKVLYDANNYSLLNVSATGDLEIETVGAGTTDSDITLNADGDIIMDAAGGDVTITSADVSVAATKKIYLDGGNDTYLLETSADILDIYVGGDKMLSLDESVDTGVTSLIGTFKIAEQANASADTAGYGQIWVDTATPNELAFTDDAGTDIIGIGKYHYETKFCGYNAGGTANFIPLNGYIYEQPLSLGRNEYITMIAPYNGTIEKILWRSEADQDGTLQMDIYESPDATEVPGTVTGTKDTTLDRIDDDITQDVRFDPMTTGTNALVKGRVYAIKITSPSASQDTNVTVVFKWDITS